MTAGTKTVEKDEEEGRSQIVVMIVMMRRKRKVNAMLGKEGNGGEGDEEAEFCVCMCVEKTASREGRSRVDEGREMKEAALNVGRTKKVCVVL